MGLPPMEMWGFEKLGGSHHGYPHIRHQQDGGAPETTFTGSFASSVETSNHFLVLGVLTQ